MKTISSEEFLKIALALEEHHSIFYFLWKAGQIFFTTSWNGGFFPRAAIHVSKQKEILFLINPDYWNSISFIKKLFVICHEGLHFYLRHFERSKNIIKQSDLIAANGAMDAIVNQMLIQSFGFSREEIDPALSDAIWPENLIDGVVLPYNKSFEYYYEQCKKYKLNLNLIDLHNFGEDYSNVVDEFCTMLPKREQSFVKKIGASKTIKTYKKTIVWPTKFLQLLRRNIDDLKNIKLEESWIKTNRRMEILKNDLILPNILNKNKKKFNISIFIDASPSCRFLVQDFFNLADSLPKLIEKDIHVFSGYVDKISKNKDGLAYKANEHTKFSCIEEYLKKQEIYPDIVCIFTDGIGDSVKPAKPNRWHFFLSKKTLNFIPKQSKYYIINEIE